MTDEDPAYVHLLLPDGKMKEDLKLPEGELGEHIKADFEEGKDLMLTVQSAMGIEAVISYKEAPK